jgi:Uma2 family endonuclease
MMISVWGPLMASTTSISVSEYLKTSYHPDCDYVDGRIEERNVGEHDHAAVQAPEDTLRRMQQRVDDYLAFGVKHVWVLDPATQRGYDCRAEGFLDAREFVVPNTPIHLGLSELFSRIRRS